MTRGEIPFDPSIAGLTSDQTNAANMNNDPSNKKDDDLPVLSDSDVEPVGGPQPPEMTDADIDAVFDEGKVVTEGGLERSPAEKASAMLLRRGVEAVTEMRNIAKQLTGEDRKKALKILRDKFINEAKVIDDTKTDAELNAMLDAQLKSAEENTEFVQRASRAEKDARTNQMEIDKAKLAAAADPKVQLFLSGVSEEMFRGSGEFVTQVREFVQGLAKDANQIAGIESHIYEALDAKYPNRRAGLDIGDDDIDAMFGGAPAAKKEAFGDDDIDDMLKNVGT